MQKTVITLVTIATVVPAYAQQYESAKITDFAGSTLDQFGRSTACTSDYFAIGAPGDNGLANDSGTIHLYEFDPQSGSGYKLATLQASDGDDNDAFGTAVAMDGDVLISGTPFHSPGQYLAGAAYVYRNNGVWSEEQKLTSPTPSREDFFGQAVAISGDVAVIGAPAVDDLGDGAGAVYVFRYDSGQGLWFFEQTLLASDGSNGDYFGSAVAIDGQVIVVGAPEQDDNRGAVYVYRYEPSTGQWLEEQKLTSPLPTSGDGLGESVAISGNVLVAGAPGDLGNGAAYVAFYSSSSMNWLPAARLEAKDGEHNDHFGYSVSIDGDLIVAGAPYKNTPQSNAGGAYVFQWTSNGITDAVLLASDPVAVDQLGSSIDICENHVFSGATGVDDRGASSGAVYVFRP